MKRRNFFKGIAAVVTSAALPFNDDRKLPVIYTQGSSLGKTTLVEIMPPRLPPIDWLARYEETEIITARIKAAFLVNFKTANEVRRTEARVYKDAN